MLESCMGGRSWILLPISISPTSNWGADCQKKMRSEIWCSTGSLYLGGWVPKDHLGPSPMTLPVVILHKPLHFGKFCSNIDHDQLIDRKIQMQECQRLRTRFVERKYEAERDTALVFVYTFRTLQCGASSTVNQAATEENDSNLTDREFYLLQQLSFNMITMVSQVEMASMMSLAVSYSLFSQHSFQIDSPKVGVSCN